MNAAMADAAASRRIYLVCGLLGAGHFALNTSLWMLTGLLPLLARDFSVSIGAAGQVISAFTISYAVSGPLLTIVFARVDRRLLLIVTLLVSAAANFFAAFAPDFGLLLGARVVAGIADGLYGATATATVFALAPQAARGRFLAVVNSGLTLAMFIGVPLATLVGHSFGWRSTFIGIAVSATLAAVGLLILLPHVAAPALLSFRDRFAIVRTPGAVPTLLVGSLSYVGMFTIYAFVTPILEQTAGVPAAAMSSLLLAFGFAAIVGNWLGGQAADRWGEPRSLAFSLLLLAPLLAVMPFLARTPGAAAALLFVWGVLHYSGISPLQLLVARFAPGNAGVAFALMNSFIYCGVALGAAVGGLAIDHLPIVTIGLVGAAFKLAALAMLLWLARRFLRTNRRLEMPGRGT